MVQLDIAPAPFRSGQDGYQEFRNPALILTRHETLVAFAEGRRAPANGKYGTDIVRSRSIDGGQTWSTLRAVTDHTTDDAASPAAATDLRTGEIVLLTCRNGRGDTQEVISAGQAPPRRVYVQRSADDGRTFNEPVDITKSVSEEGWRWYATGPGQAVTIRNGPRLGRIVVPCNHSKAPEEGDKGDEYVNFGGHAVYSDDGGHTWQLGFASPRGRGFLYEATACELSDGWLYFNCRTSKSDKLPGTRADAYSQDGGETLAVPYLPQATLRTPPVPGAVVRVPGGRLLYAGCTSPDELAAMGLWVSSDSGSTWRLGKQLSGLPAGQASAVLLGSGHVGLLYETGDWSPYERIEFARVGIAGLR